MIGDDDRLWRKDQKGNHKVVVAEGRRLFLLAAAHNDVGHHGFYVTNALLSERYWWPMMLQDIAWFIRTCHLCQLRKTQQVLIPPTVAMPAPLFSKVYIDTMHLTPSSGYKYIVQGCCSALADTLARMGYVTEGDSQDSHELHSTQYNLQMGHFTRNRDR